MNFKYTTEDNNGKFRLSFIILVKFNKKYITSRLTVL